MSGKNYEGNGKRRTNPTKILVIGTGGAGNNAVQNMIERGLEGTDFLTINTDANDLYNKTSDMRLEIGRKTCGGNGAGGDPEIGAQAAKESDYAIKEVIHKYDMIFIVAGMGGGTGGGSAPFIAHMAKGMGILTISVITLPFRFEGHQRMQKALLSEKSVIQESDMVIEIKNDNLFKLNPKISFKNAFVEADDVLYYAVRGIVSIIMSPGDVSIDFADVKTITKDVKDIALLNVSAGRGANRAKDIVQNLFNHPLLDIDIDNATRVLYNIAYSAKSPVTLEELETIATGIKNHCDPNANIIFGYYEDDTLDDTLQVTLVASE